MGRVIFGHDPIEEMAMTKSEKARVEELERELAFRWPTVAEPIPQDIPTKGETEGWLFNAHNASATHAWSKSYMHGTYYNGKRLGASQQGVRLYRTKADALIALRWAMCREFARKLYAVDQALASETPHEE